MSTTETASLPRFPPGDTARRSNLAVWSFLVSTGVCPGLVQAIRLILRLREMTWRRRPAARQGRPAPFPRAGSTGLPALHA